VYGIVKKWADVFKAAIRRCFYEFILPFIVVNSVYKHDVGTIQKKVQATDLHTSLFVRNRFTQFFTK
jgi:hypothetical protein